MSGERRRVETVVARGLARTLAAGTALTAFGGLALLGCVWAWVREAGAAPPTLWFLGAAGGFLFLGGMLGVVAFGWARS